MLLLYLLNQKRSLDCFHERNKTDAEKIKSEVNDVFTQTEFDTSSQTEVSPIYIFLTCQRYYSNSERLLTKPASFYSSVKFDADDEISSLNVNSAHPDFLSFYTATFPRQDPFAIFAKNIPDPIESYSLF